MSYAADVKKELTGLIVHAGNAKAELAALMRMNGVSTLGLIKQFGYKLKTLPLPVEFIHS